MPDSFQIEPKNGTLSHEALTSEIWGKTIFSFLSPKIQIPIAKHVLVETDRFKDPKKAKALKFHQNLKLCDFHFWGASYRVLKNHIQNWDSFYVIIDQKRCQKACGARIGVSFSPPLFDQIDSFLYFWKLQSFPKTNLKSEYDRILKRVSKIAKWPSSVRNGRFWTTYLRAQQNQPLIYSI